MANYRPAQYWESLLSRQYDLAGVGYPDLPVEFNAALYAQMLRSVRRLITRHGVRIAGADVLEIGPGTGFWIDEWTRARAASVTGVDITASAVQHLAQRFPTQTFLQADVGDESFDVPGTFDVVSVMSVLLHIVDDHGFERALANIAARLRPGGVFLLMEPLVVKSYYGAPFTAESNSKARTIGEWRAALGTAGLVLVDQQPVTALLANVCDTKRQWGFRLHEQYWYRLTRFVQKRPAAAGPLSRALGQLDRAMLGAGIAPSAKVMLVRHKGA